MKFKSETEMLSKVSKHEAEMLYAYNQVYDKYKEEFVKYQCLLNIEMKWYNCYSIKSKLVDYRIPLKIGYICHIDFVVQQNGEDIKLECEDGEVAYYELGNSINVTAIDWWLGKRVRFFSTAEDFEEEVLEFLEMLRTHKLYSGKVFGK